MRAAFRLIGGIRFVVGMTIVLATFAFRSQLGEIWTGLLVLFGAMVGVSGMVGILLVLTYFILVPFVFVGIDWLLFDAWGGGPILRSFLRFLDEQFVLVKGWWVLSLVFVPIAIWRFNESWFFMVRNFAIDEEPGDTTRTEMHEVGAIRVNDSFYIGAATLTKQGIILDRRNFAPVILPWKWVTSADADETATLEHPKMKVQLRSDANEFMTLVIPLNSDLLRANAARGGHNAT